MLYSIQKQIIHKLIDQLQLIMSFKRKNKKYSLIFGLIYLFKNIFL